MEENPGKSRVGGLWQELRQAQKDFSSACASEKHQADTIRPGRDLLSS